MTQYRVTTAAAQSVSIAALTLATAVAVSVWLLGGAAAARYSFVIALVSVSGLPLGFALFGRHHAAGWIAGALLGYVLTGVVCWAVIAIGRPSTGAFVAAWGCETAATWLVFIRMRRADRPLIELPAWTRRETAALLLVLLLVPGIVTRPFSRIGSLDDQGDQRFRAYFTADFVWHMALVAELEKHEQPPRNPYLASQPIHYYWMYFMVPAVAGPLARTDTALTLQVNALLTSLLFLSAVFIFAWTCLPGWPFTVAASVFLTVVAASLEGTAALVYVRSQGAPLASVRDMNVDALSRGLGGLRIDDLPRAMWYTPQHAMSYALGLMGLLVVIRGAGELRPLGIVVSAIALGGSVLLNPFVGGMFCIVYAAGVLIDADVYRGLAVRICLRHTIALVPVAAALAWIVLNRIAEGAGATLHFGLFGPAANAPAASLLLSLGPIFALLCAGAWPYRRVNWRPIAVAATGLTLSLIVMYFVTMTVDLFWVGFRMGHLFLVFAPAVATRALVWLYSIGRKAAVAVAVAVLLIGGPTTVIDVFNAQDVENADMGPGFHWTLKITPAEQEALAWIRQRTPVDAIVQAEPTVRGRETWSLIPSFGERRMAGGQPISLMHVREYDAVTAQVREIYSTNDDARAWRLATALGIDYLYIDATERSAYPAVTKFDNAPDLFPTAFRNEEAVIVAVSHAHR